MLVFQWGKPIPGGGVSNTQILAKSIGIMQITSQFEPFEPFDNVKKAQKYTLLNLLF